MTNFNRKLVEDEFDPIKEGSYILDVRHDSLTVVDTSSGPVTARLPQTPRPHTRVSFLDAKGTFATNNLIVVPAAGDTIMGEDGMIIDMNYMGPELVFLNSTWQLEGI